MNPPEVLEINLVNENLHPQPKESEKCDQKEAEKGSTIIGILDNMMTKKEMEDVYLQICLDQNITDYHDRKQLKKKLKRKLKKNIKRNQNGNKTNVL